MIQIPAWAFEPFKGLLRISLHVHTTPSPSIEHWDQMRDRTSGNLSLHKLDSSSDGAKTYRLSGSAQSRPSLKTNNPTGECGCKVTVMTAHVSFVSISERALLGERRPAGPLLVTGESRANRCFLNDSFQGVDPIESRDRMNQTCWHIIYFY